MDICSCLSVSFVYLFCLFISLLSVYLSLSVYLAVSVFISLSRFCLSHPHFSGSFLTLTLILLGRIVPCLAGLRLFFFNSESFQSYSHSVCFHLLLSFQTLIFLPFLIFSCLTQIEQKGPADVFYGAASTVLY